MYLNYQNLNSNLKFLLTLYLILYLSMEIGFIGKTLSNAIEIKDNGIEATLATYSAPENTQQ